MIYVCLFCKYIYNPARGDLKRDIPPNTSWEHLDNSWSCPICHATKRAFKKKIKLLEKCK